MIDAASWLLLLHHIPPQPPYLRAKVMRRLSKLGALPLKRSAYLLPAEDTALEDLQWLLQEIRNEGGDAWIVEGHFVGGLSDDEIRERFRGMRVTNYQALAAEARSLLERVPRGEASGGDEIGAVRRRLLKRVEAVRRIDPFHADGRNEVEALMASLERSTQAATDKAAHTEGREQLQARTWVTRAGARVDRMASAWLIRRFIDPAATFVFVPPDRASSVPGALRFDMFEGEFTHDGNRCTFEVLLDVAERATDPALAAIGQIVHDVDLRDDRHQRPETAGVSAMIDGIVARFDDDHRRLSESAPFFDALYASLGGGTSQ